MRLPDEAIVEYMEIYKEEFGEEISMDDAREQAENFMRLSLFLFSK